MNPVFTKILLILAAAACAAVGALVPGVKGTPLGATLLSAAGLSLGLAFPEVGKLTSSKGGQAGFARLSLLATLCACAVAFCAACAAFRGMTVADAEKDVLTYTGHLVDACSVPLLASSKNKTVRQSCLAVQIAQQAEEITVELTPPPLAVPAGGSGAQ